MCPKFEDIDLAMVESTFRSNILQMFAITKFALPHMKRGSCIINTTSVVAYAGSPALGKAFPHGSVKFITLSDRAF
jgi:NAD(P)-dependent dehydrogenase (short-subunit alcohol dehydrogenase family)